MCCKGVTEIQGRDCGDGKLKRTDERVKTLCSPTSGLNDGRTSNKPHYFRFSSLLVLNSLSLACFGLRSYMQVSDWR